MPFSDRLTAVLATFRQGLKWLGLLAILAGAVGSAVAFFLWSLDWATRTRWEHPWLLWWLPVGGFGIGYLYHRWGRSAEAGNNLILDQIHEPGGGGVPKRMAPLILFGTVATHLFGGSAGREGTAVQMGGSLAATLARFVRLDAKDLRLLLMAGVAAGFGAVFGTPLAGAVFALEVLVVGRMEHRALWPCFVAALLADACCHAWGIGHTVYPLAAAASGIAGAFKVDPVLWLKVAAAAMVFGWVAALFAALSHRLAGWMKSVVPYPPLRPALGGVAVIGLVLLSGTRDFLGLGVTHPDPEGVSILSFFTSSEIHPWAWAWKLVFTVVTLGCGFKGGEVTPLFFIGAALGNALAGVTGAPTDLFAAAGFVAVFAGATNAPLACTLMGIELFGAEHGLYLATACFVAYRCSGHAGIYRAQRIVVRKDGSPAA